MKYKTTQVPFSKILCFSFLFFFTSFINQAQNTANTAVGILEFEQDLIDYGTVAYNAAGTKTFSFVNIGNAPVIIAEVKTSCGCTVAEKPKKPIMPGESSKITVQYATNRVGSFSKKITIMSNAAQAQKLLTIKGKVLPKESLR
ncbi:MAG: hypothetical protein ACI849_000361 [Patiriisocius sp.]|jgi:hypothetical protein